MAKREPKMMSVVTLPLKTEIWQEDVLNKRFELCRKIYNNMLHYELKQLNKAMNDKRYRDAKAVINEVYKLSNEKEKKERKKSEEFKEAAKITNDILKEYGLTEYGFTAEVLKQREVYKTNIPSVVASLSVAKPMWAAMDKKLFGNGNALHYKKKDTWRSMASDGKSGIRLVNADEKTVLHREGNEKLWVKMSVPHGKTVLIPVMIDPKDSYKAEMLDRNVKIVRITRKFCKTKYHYYVQLTVEGAPAIRYDKDGNLKNPVGHGKVGMYIDTTSVTLALPNGDVQYISLKSDGKTAAKIAELQRYMEASRRAMNPDNYNEDGTIKKGIWEDGRIRRLHWVESNGYKCAKQKLRNLYRVESENRTLVRQVLANQILSYGDEIVVNDYAFQSAAMRKKVKNEATGEVEKHKKAGKAIGENAPATLVMLIESKLKAKAGNGITRVKLDVDFEKEKYREFYAKELLNYA